MLYIRFEYERLICQGIVERNSIVPVKDSPFDDIPSIGKPVDLHNVKILAPVLPSKIVCVGLNYRDHAAELGMEIPKEPLLFLKPSSAITGTDCEIIYPNESTRLDYEAEMGIVIGRRCKKVSSDESGNYIFGYTCLNDITARDLQKKDGQWTRAKSFDTFCPIGPYISNNIDPNSLKIELLLNGEIKQSSNTSRMIFKPEKLVEFISAIMTLEKGDVIATGTPPGVGAMKRADGVEVRIEKIGSLINKVI